MSSLRCKTFHLLCIVAIIFSVFTLGEGRSLRGKKYISSNLRLLQEGANSDPVLPRSVGTFTVEHASFLTYDVRTDRLVVSSFTGNPFEHGKVFSCPTFSHSFSSLQESGNVSCSVLLDGLAWPNLLTMIQPEHDQLPFDFIFGDGFLVPGKSTGNLVSAVYGSTSSSPGSDWKLAKAKDGFFYHKGVISDIDGDGNPDILTARATKPIIGESRGEFLWLRNPGRGKETTTPWEEHLLVSDPSVAPDIFFAVADIDGDGKEEVFASLFFQKKLVVVWSDCEKCTGLTGFANASSIRTAVIDDSLGSLFSVDVVDVNGDGRLDLLVTNHVNDINLSGVFVFELIPGKDYRSSSSWIRHKIAANFQVREKGIAQATPGNAQLFYPNLNISRDGGKPFIAVSGDGSQRAYILIPSDPTSTSSWDYEKLILVDVAGTVGQVIVSDFNNDGFSDLLVPDYDHSTIHAFTYAPPSQGRKE